MKITKKLIIGFFLFFILIVLYSYRLVEGFNYDNDFGRDIYDILGIAKGNLRLLGPRLSFGGFISGPYYYYLFAIPLWLFKGNPESLLYFSVFLHSLVFFIFYLFLIKKDGFLSSFLFLLWLATSTYMFFSIRNPGNAFSYYWLILVFFIFPFFKKQSYFLLIVLGFLAGVISNFHFVNLIIFACFWVIYLWEERKKWQKPFYFLGGLFLSFVPQLLFELRHGFVMIKNTFIAKSYQNFTIRALPTTLTVSPNPLKNFFLISQHMARWLQTPFLILFFLTAFFYFKNKNKLNQNQKIIVKTTFLSFSILLVLARYQFVFHYFLPFILLFQFSLFLVIKNKFVKMAFFNLLLLFNFYYFPKEFYETAPRQFSDYSKFVDTILEKKLIEKNDKYNIFIVRETPYAVAGWEYRYFLKKEGFDPLSSFLYKDSQKMLVIAEPGSHIDLDNLKTWEFEQFGEYNIVSDEDIIKRRVILLQKK